MVVRSWEGRARAGAAAQYFTYLTDVVLPHIRTIPGNEGARVFRGADGDADRFVVQTLWTSRAVIEAFAGPDIGHAVVPPAAQALLVEYDERARHFDVVLDVGRTAP